MTDEHRIATLETQLRSTRRTLWAVIGGTAIMALLAFTQAPRAPQDLTVRSLTVLAADGHKIAAIGDGGGTPALDLYGPSEGYSSFGIAGLLISNGGGTIAALVGNQQASLGISGPGHGSGQPVSSAIITAVDGAPTIALTDRSGFEMYLGSASTTSTLSGGNTTTSAATITMFGNDKDHKVIWQAPR